MVQLNTRQTDIILALLEVEQPVSANWLGRRLGISARVIRYNLATIESWLLPRGAKLSVGSRKGISLQTSEAVRQALRIELKGKIASTHYSTTDRLRILLFELLSSDDYATGSDLAEALAVSYSTMRRDLDRAELWLADNRLQLERRPRLGITVIGDEIGQRHTLISLLLHIGLEPALHDICLWRINPQQIVSGIKRQAQAVIVERITAWDLPSAWRTITRIMMELDTSFAETVHLYLALYWAVMRKRVQAHRIVQLPKQKAAFAESLPEYAAVRSAADALERETGESLPNNEVAHFSLEVLTSPREREPTFGPSTLHYPQASEGLQEFARYLVNKTSEYTDRPLADPEVPARMAQHLIRTVARLNHGLPIINHLTDDVRETYPQLWRITSEAAEQSQAVLGILLPQQEIAFLTMYLALAFRLTDQLWSQRAPRVIIACPSGGVTVSILLSRLKSDVPEVEVVSVTALKHLGRVDPGTADAIISTVPVKSRSIPVIVVSPLLTKQNVYRIRKVLGLSHPYSETTRQL